MGCFGVMMFSISKLRIVGVASKIHIADQEHRKGQLVTSEKGKALQEKAWAEIVEVLRPHFPKSGSFGVDYTQS